MYYTSKNNLNISAFGRHIFSGFADRERMRERIRRGFDKYHLGEPPSPPPQKALNYTAFFPLFFFIFLS